MARILVVDDEPNICSFLEWYLKEKGHTVLTASNGEDAINIVKDERPHIVLLDINMPRMDGITTLKKIREIDKEIGVIMITAALDEEIGKKALDLGADDYITKPIDFNYLDNVLMVKITMMTG